MDIREVRRIAGVCGWQEVQFNHDSRVIGFVRGVERVNVYYTTGTVGTCIDHPRRGQTQLFRRNQSMHDLAQIFNNPRVHTSVGYYRRHSSQREEPSQRTPASGLWCSLADPACQQALLHNWSSKCDILALGDGGGCFVVGSDGSHWYWGVPRSLENKVKGRQKSLAPVEYVALGTDGEYYVQFADGTLQWFGNDPLSAALHAREYESSVELLAFAPGGGYYILWEDGCDEWNGVPVDLHNQLNGRQKSLPGVEFLAIGPEGEWFVRFLDGSWKVRLVTDGCTNAIEELQAQGCDVLKVVFGGDSSWAIVYS